MKGRIIEIKYVGSKISKLGMLKRELVNWNMGQKKIFRPKYKGRIKIEKTLRRIYVKHMGDAWMV